MSDIADENRNVKKAIAQFQIKGGENTFEVGKINALLRYHFKIDPDKLNDNEWAKSWGELKYALNAEAERYKTG